MKRNENDNNKKMLIIWYLFNKARKTHHIHLTKSQYLRALARRPTPFLFIISHCSHFNKLYGQAKITRGRVRAL